VAEINAMEATARAIYDALRQADPAAYMDEFDMEFPVTIDGRFQLHALAALVLIHLNGQLGQTLFQLAQTQSKRSSELR
jgi:hypothetical protein